MRVGRARYFLAAVRTGSLRAAAVVCGVSQPTIGQQITLLEEDLDTVLLTRSRSGVRPTAAGEALVEPLGRLVAAEDAVREAALERHGAYEGRVLLGGGSVTAETILAPVVGRLRAAHPGLRFAVREGASAELEAAVGSGELDLAAITAPAMPPAAGLRRELLFTSAVGLHVRPDHPLAARTGVRWAELAAWPIVTMRGGTVLSDLLHAHVEAPETVVEAMSARTVQVMVAHGAGLGVLARMGPPADGDPAWIPITDADPVRVCLVQRRDRPLSRSATVVRDLVRERARELAAR